MVSFHFSFVDLVNVPFVWIRLHIVYLLFSFFFHPSPLGGLKLPSVAYVFLAVAGAGAGAVAVAGAGAGAVAGAVIFFYALHSTTALIASIATGRQSAISNPCGLTISVRSTGPPNLHSIGFAGP
jgi:hypothetical protein